MKRRRGRDPTKSRARVKQWQRRQRAKLDAIKLERGCVDCGYNDHPAALDFDHRDPTTKEIRVSDRLNGWPKILAEIEKCDVRCANCHRIRTAEEGHNRRRRGQADIIEEATPPQAQLWEDTG